MHLNTSDQAQSLPNQSNSPQSDMENSFDLSVALNYGYSAGSPHLLRFVTEHIELIHHPGYGEWESCLTSGTTSALDVLLRMLCNPSDCILAEEFSYPGTLDAAKPLRISIEGVRMDSLGLMPDDLEAKLQSWDETRGAKPSVLYTIPSGQNPTSSTQSAQRRHDIYAVAEKHDLIIVEDDPYFFLQLRAPAKKTLNGEISPEDEYLQQLPPSYLSLDTCGRVIRLDSTSKILAPGLRCAWMTACSQLIRAFLNFTEVSSVAPSGLSQVALYRLLDQQWGHLGFLRWLMRLSAQYSQCRDVLVSACERYLPRKLCQWTIPVTGMFLFITFPRLALGQADEDDHNETVLEMEDKIYRTSLENGVAVSKGSWFAVNQQMLSCITMRLTFTAAPAETFDRAVQQFSHAIYKHLGHLTDSSSCAHVST